MPETVSEVLGNPISYQQVSFDAFAAQLRGQGMSDTFVRGYVDMMRAKAEGVDNEQPRRPEGTTPTTFGQWCEEEFQPACMREAEAPGRLWTAETPCRPARRTFQRGIGLNICKCALTSVKCLGHLSGACFASFGSR